jgi:hypothetical protein
VDQWLIDINHVQRAKQVRQIGFEIIPGGNNNEQISETSTYQRASAPVDQSPMEPAHFRESSRRNRKAAQLV